MPDSSDLQKSRKAVKSVFEKVSILKSYHSESPQSKADGWSWRDAVREESIPARVAN
jgi:hypothetical protein